MLLYHGSNMAGEEPKILPSGRRLGFGTGFYLTSSYEQAERWAILTAKRRKNGRETITAYEFNEDMLSDMNVLRFDGASIEWLKFVSDNRNIKDFADYSAIVIGPVANDRAMPVLRRYFTGIYDEAETLKRLLPQKLKDQYAFKKRKSPKGINGWRGDKMMRSEMALLLPFYNEKVSQMIVDKYGSEPLAALRKFLFSDTYKMLADPELEMWEFSPFGIFDMWEAEQITGNPRNSLYIRRD